MNHLIDMTNRKGSKFDIRWTDEQQTLIRQAAALNYSNPTSFIRDNAVEAAKKVLEDQRRFVLHKDEWDAVVAALDASASVLPNLKKELSKADDWDMDKFAAI